MKQIVFFTLIMCFLASCQKTEFELNNHNTSHNLLVTTKTSDDTWTNHEYCTLNGASDSVKAPWAEYNVVTSIPSGIRKDVKEEDGWNILFSTIVINGYKRDYNFQKTDKSANYIVLYNRYTGMLKGFCYLTGVVQQNNMALWHLSTKDSTRLFNFAGEYAIPYNGPKAKDVYISNITTENVANGFNQGWNCFMLELAYDEDSPQTTLNIEGITLNETSYNLDGTMGFESNGVIVTTTQKPQNSILKGAATAIGDAAKKYIEENLEKKSSTRGVVATTVGSIVAAGASKIFSSIFGKSSATTSEQTVSVKSKGEVTITGKSTQPASGIITPISDIPLNKLGYALGIWNLLDYPTYQMGEIATLKNYFDNGAKYAFRYSIETSTKYTQIINPTQKQYSASTNIVYRDGFKVYGDVGMDTNPEKIYDGTTSLPSLYTLPSTFNVLILSCIPSYSYGSSTPVTHLKSTYKDLYQQNADINVVQKIYNKDIFVSSKTFVGKCKFYDNKSSIRPYAWTLNELTSKGYKVSK